jgi:hypothetical protein
MRFSAANLQGETHQKAEPQKRNRKTSATKSVG